MDFYQGGLYSQYRDEGCFIKYMADAIQSAQLHLKNEQWDINVDFEEFIYIAFGGIYVEKNHCSVSPERSSGKNVHATPAGALLSTGIAV